MEQKQCLSLAHITLKILKTVTAKIKLNYIQRLSSYRAGNTLRLGYKNQSFYAIRIQRLL